MGWTAQLVITREGSAARLTTFCGSFRSQGAWEGNSNLNRRLLLYRDRGARGPLSRSFLQEHSIYSPFFASFFNDNYLADSRQQLQHSRNGCASGCFFGSQRHVGSNFLGVCIYLHVCTALSISGFSRYHPSANLSCRFYGLTTLQTWLYFTYNFKDEKILRGSVSLLW